MHSNSPTSSCKPLLEGAVCQTEQQRRRHICSSGFCGGESLLVSLVLLSSFC
jgi:hypothetical protein